MEETFKMVKVSERLPETSLQYHTDKGLCQFDNFTKTFRLDGTNDFVQPSVWFEKKKNDFENMSSTVLGYINENHHPMSTIVATTTTVEVFESVKSTGEVFDYIKD